MILACSKLSVLEKDRRGMRDLPYDLKSAGQCGSQGIRKQKG
jgi:hypothetical protein